MPSAACHSLGIISPAEGLTGRCKASALADFMTLSFWIGFGYRHASERQGLFV